MKPSDMPRVAPRAPEGHNGDGGPTRLDAIIDGDDLRLSFTTSPRRKDRRERFLRLRSLFVRRLRHAPKAILRLPIKHDINVADTGKYQMFCEPCHKWLRFTVWGEEFECPRCGSLYAIEYAIYSQIKEEVSETPAAD